MSNNANYTILDRVNAIHMVIYHCLPHQAIYEARKTAQAKVEIIEEDSLFRITSDIEQLAILRSFERLVGVLPANERGKKWPMWY